MTTLSRLLATLDEAGEALTAPEAALFADLPAPSVRRLIGEHKAGTGRMRVVQRPKRVCRVTGRRCWTWIHPVWSAEQIRRIRSDAQAMAAKFRPGRIAP